MGSSIHGRGRAVGWASLRILKFSVGIYPLKPIFDDKSEPIVSGGGISNDGAQDEMNKSSVPLALPLPHHRSRR